MARREFPRAVKVAVIKRANGLCEAPGCGLPHLGRFEIDHINPDGLTGEPTLANAMLLCIPCHKDKTRQDVAAIAKAKRREADHLGARLRPKQEIRSPGFLPADRRRENPMPGLPPRRLFREA